MCGKLTILQTEELSERPVYKRTLAWLQRWFDEPHQRFLLDTICGAKLG